MSYWSHNPELLDEITARALPEPWKTRVEEEEIDLCDVPESIRDKAMDRGVEDYWGDRIDAAYEQHKDDELRKGGA
jgi:hypothetical protein